MKCNQPPRTKVEEDKSMSYGQMCLMEGIYKPIGDGWNNTRFVVLRELDSRTIIGFNKQSSVLSPVRGWEHLRFERLDYATINFSINE